MIHQTNSIFHFQHHIIHFMYNITVITENQSFADIVLSTFNAARFNTDKSDSHNRFQSQSNTWLDGYSLENLVISNNNITSLAPETLDENHAVSLGSNKAYLSEFSLLSQLSRFSTSLPSPLLDKNTSSSCMAHSIPGNTRSAPDFVATNWNLFITHNIRHIRHILMLTTLSHQYSPHTFVTLQILLKLFF